MTPNNFIQYMFVCGKNEKLPRKEVRRLSSVNELKFHKIKFYGYLKRKIFEKVNFIHTFDNEIGLFNI